MKTLGPLTKHDVNWMMLKTFKLRQCWSAGVGPKPYGMGESPKTQNEAKGKSQTVSKDGKV